MKKNKIFALMVAAMTFAACTNNDITSDTRYDDDNVVTIGTVTRTGEGSTTSQFTGTFLLTNVTQRENVGDNYEATYEYDSSNSTWTAQDNAKIMWYGSGDNQFQATYPCYTKSGYTKLENIDFNKFMIPGYQYIESDSIPDWMRATANVARSNGALNLKFEHMLSKVTVEIDYNNITLDDNAVTSASVSKIFTRVQYCEAVTDADGKVTINPFDKSAYNTDGLYVWTTAQSDADNKKASTTAIVAPGDYTNIAKAVISCGGDDKEIELSIPTGYTLEAGKHYTFTLSNAAITPDQATISSVSVEPWTEGPISSSKPAEFIPYVTFTSNEEVGFKMTTNNYTISGLEYSVNNGEWTPIPSNGISDEVTFGGTKGKLRVRGKNPNGTATDIFNYAFISFSSNETNAKVACTGDIRTLLDWENYNTVDTKNARFCCLFKDCTRLTSAPELPATTLADWCYSYMFEGCTALTTAPELKAEILAYYCCENMFKDCTSLTTAPALPATTLAEGCYYNMFYGCESLTTAPALPATTLADDCYSYMFMGCSSLTTAPALPATTLADYCYSRMFSGCTSLTKAPELPATELAYYCYYYMFNGCESLTTAPELKATTLAEFCYFNMFAFCTKLQSVTMLATNVSASYCLDDWLYEAGTGASERTLKVASQTAYDAIKSNLPANWQAGATGAKILDKDGNDITSTITSSSSN